MAHGRSKGTPGDERPWRLEAAAVLEETTRVAGIGWKLVPSEGTPLIHARTLRHGQSLVYAELTAVRDGLLAACRLHPPRLVIAVPGALSVRLLRGGSPGRARRAAKAAARVRSLWASFGQVRILQLRPVDPGLSHAIGEALDVGLHAAAEQTERRAQAMEHIISRAQGVRLERTEAGWLANGRYRVSLDPLGCDCPAWSRRWARLSIAGRRAQRLLCKHLVALAMAQGIRSPDELVALARRAPR